MQDQDNVVKPLNAVSFYQYLREGKLMGIQCQYCGQLSAEARSMCQNCHSSEINWFQFSGEAELGTFTCISIVPASMAEKGYGRDNPYCTGIVILAEGPRISARILNVNTLEPQSIQIGTKMVLDLSDVESDKPILSFRPV
jgi:uncharacterized OB-fold protein